MEALSTWCSAAHNAGHTWTAIPDQVLCNATFRWQTTEAIDHLSQHPDALLKALAETALIPGHGSAPGWATLHHTVIDILFDTLGVSSYLGARIPANAATKCLHGARSRSNRDTAQQSDRLPHLVTGIISRRPVDPPYPGATSNCAYRRSGTDRPHLKAV